MLLQSHYQADERCDYSGLASSTVNSFKAEDKNLSVVPCMKISGLQSRPHSRRVTRVESWHSRMVIQALPLLFRLFTQNSP